MIRCRLHSNKGGQLRSSPLVRDSGGEGGGIFYRTDDADHVLNHHMYKRPSLVINWHVESCILTFIDMMYASWGNNNMAYELLI